MKQEILRCVCVCVCRWMEIALWHVYSVAVHTRDVMKRLAITQQNYLHSSLNYFPAFQPFTLSRSSYYTNMKQKHLNNDPQDDILMTILIKYITMKVHSINVNVTWLRQPPFIFPSQPILFTYFFLKQKRGSARSIFLKDSEKSPKNTEGEDHLSKIMRSRKFYFPG